jgi:hypothetical protein
LGSDSGKYRSQRRFVLFGQCVLKKSAPAACYFYCWDIVLEQNCRLRRAVFDCADIVYESNRRPGRCLCGVHAGLGPPCTSSRPTCRRTMSKATRSRTRHPA